MKLWAICAGCLCGCLFGGAASHVVPDAALQGPPDASDQRGAAADAGEFIYSACGAATAGTFAALGDAGIPEARYQHAMVWTGTEMLVWGGLGFEQPPVMTCTTCTCFDAALNTGGRYHP